jgi:hypothetical protein
MSKRGPYRKYLQNSSVPIPKKTFYSWTQHKRQKLKFSSIESNQNQHQQYKNTQNDEHPDMNKKTIIV